MSQWPGPRSENVESRSRVRGTDEAEVALQAGTPGEGMRTSAAPGMELSIMKSTKTIRKSEVYQGTGLLPEVADRATAGGFRYFTLNGKVFEIEAGRIEGSSLGLHSLKGAALIE